jgi:O-antigen/teichoic acid export membrane protein
MIQESDNGDISRKSKQSLVWFTVVPVGLHIFRFINTIILARILSPQDFGIVGLAAIIFYLSNSLTEFGFSKSIVQRKQISHHHYDTYFSFNLIVSALLYLLFYTLSGLISDFFNEPNLVPSIEIVITLFLISALTSVPITVLKREIQFETLAITEILRVCASIAISLSLALSGFEFFSIVYAMVFSELIGLVYLRSKVRVRPTLSLRFNYLRELSSFAIWDFFWGQAKNLFDNLDKIIIGRVLDATQLGFYDKAQSLAKMPNEQFSNRLSMVSFSVFSRLQNSPQELQAYFSKIMVANSVVCFPVFVGLFLVAENMTLILFGEKWFSMIEPLKLMSLVFLIASLGAPVVAINIAMTRIRQQVIIHLLGIVLLVSGLIWAVPKGIVAASYALLYVNVFLFAASFLLMRQHIQISVAKLLAFFFPAFSCSAILWFFVKLIGYCIPDAGRGQFLVSEILVGGLAYSSAIFLIPFGRLDFLKSNAKSMLRGALNSFRFR